MTDPLNDLYALYAELEGIPAKAAADAKSAADARSSVIHSAEESKKATLQTCSRAQSDAQKVATSASAALDQQLKTRAQSASAKGSIPSSAATASGRPPAFAAVKAVDEKLGSLLEDKRRLTAELARLEEQLAHGLGLEAARREDVVSGILSGVGVVLAVLVGANWAAVSVALIFAIIIGARLSRRPSLFMHRRIENTPALGYDQRKRIALTRVVATWYGLCLLAVTGVASLFLAGIFPVLTGILVRWQPDPFFWGAIAVSIVVMGLSYRRLAGR